MNISVRRQNSVILKFLIKNSLMMSLDKKDLIKNEDLELKVAALLVKIVLVSADGQLITGVLVTDHDRVGVHLKH